ncbi:hypothetical protein E2C01_064374 [Portunus trituberculatus]|uniref:Uncharacterized protein n=1 Tax=Portunus trituberculatus TaxID=210409 RepID=A0A5B7HKM9_PORTR|nr:hypothetical protein [Portunus trituberculatus]
MKSFQGQSLSHSRHEDMHIVTYQTSGNTESKVTHNTIREKQLTQREAFVLQQHNEHTVFV